MVSLLFILFVLLLVCVSGRLTNSFPSLLIRLRSKATLPMLRWIQKQGNKKKKSSKKTNVSFLVKVDVMVEFEYAFKQQQQQHASTSSSSMRKEKDNVDECSKKVKVSLSSGFEGIVVAGLYLPQSSSRRGDMFQVSRRTELLELQPLLPVTHLMSTPAGSSEEHRVIQNSSSLKLNHIVKEKRETKQSLTWRFVEEWRREEEEEAIDSLWEAMHTLWDGRVEDYVDKPKPKTSKFPKRVRLVFTSCFGASS